MLFAFGLCEFDQILIAQPRRFGQHRARHADLVIFSQPPDHGAGRLLDGRDLAAHFGECNAGRDIGERADFDGLDQAFEHVAEQLDLLAGKAVGRRQEQVRDAPEGIEMLFGGPGMDSRLDFIGNSSV